MLMGISTTPGEIIATQNSVILNPWIISLLYDKCSVKGDNLCVGIVTIPVCCKTRLRPDFRGGLYNDSTGGGFPVELHGISVSVMLLTRIVSSLGFKNEGFSVDRKRASIVSYRSNYSSISLPVTWSQGFKIIQPTNERTRLNSLKCYFL